MTQWESFSSLIVEFDKAALIFHRMALIHCSRCGQERDQMPFRPFQNEIGLKAFQQICNVCWQEWLTTQKQLMNHYALDPRDAKAKEFLYTNMETFLFGAQQKP